ncbi:MAG: hypothetical protein V3575_04310 [Candidatus Absconditabacteria bacterium]
MSIFPKNIIQGDNVIIHVKLKNDSKIILPIYVNLTINHCDSSFKKTILDNRLFLVAPESGVIPGILETYYSFETDETTPFGRYKCNLDINYLNINSKSLTDNNAYFFIHKVLLKRNEDGILIENKINYNVDIKVSYINKVYKIILLPLESKLIDKKGFLNIVYANNNILTC